MMPIEFSQFEEAADTGELAEVRFVNGASRFGHARLRLPRLIQDGWIECSTSTHPEIALRLNIDLFFIPMLFDMRFCGIGCMLCGLLAVPVRKMSMMRRLFMLTFFMML